MNLENGMAPPAPAPAGETLARPSPSRIWRKCRALAPYGGWRTVLAGGLARPRLAYLRRRYGFPRWHLWPVEWREYALEAAAHVQQRIDREGLRSAVEIGCGLGGILARLRCPRKAGYDVDPRVLAAARRLHPGLDFHRGSFREVRPEALGGEPVDIVLAINFAHEIDPDRLEADLAVLLERCRPRYLVVDEVDYQHFHDWAALLPATYAPAWTSRELENRRRLRSFRRGEP